MYHSESHKRSLWQGKYSRKTRKCSCNSISVTRMYMRDTRGKDKHWLWPSIRRSHTTGSSYAADGPVCALSSLVGTHLGDCKAALLGRTVVVKFWIWSSTPRQFKLDLLKINRSRQSFILYIHQRPGIYQNKYGIRDVLSMADDGLTYTSTK